ncbi:MAG TPA: hypothetical protein VM074_01815 [Solimonas sp.]|nr:hypothetical protein [Solimonas sp.]
MAVRIHIDALNVAYWCGSPPALRIPLGLMAALLAAGHRATLYFDASARYRLGNVGVYELLLKHSGHVIQAPSGRRADQLMLRDARASGALIVSRDHFRDHRRRYRKLIDDPARVLTGEVRDDRVRVPSLSLDAPLPASDEAAWQALTTTSRA